MSRTLFRDTNYPGPFVLQCYIAGVDEAGLIFAELVWRREGGLVETKTGFDGVLENRLGRYSGGSVIIWVPLFSSSVFVSSI